MKIKNNGVFLVFTGLGFLVISNGFLKKGSLSKKSKIVLYHLEYCPFCEKVIRKLEDLDLEYKSKEITEEKYKKELAKKRDGSTTVPYIEIDGEGMGESDEIIAMLDERFGNVDYE